MTIKQFKKRVIYGLMEEELFKMPVGKREIKKGHVGIQCYFYNTFNISTKEYYNDSSLGNASIRCQIILKNSTNAVIYKGYGHNKWFYDLPYGKYYVKIIEAIGAIVDNKFYEIEVNKDYQQYSFYLPIHWFEVKKIFDNSGEYKLWQSGVGINNFKGNTYFSKIIVKDEYSGEEVAQFPSPNMFTKVATKDSYTDPRYHQPAGDIYSSKLFFEVSYDLYEDFSFQYHEQIGDNVYTCNGKQRRMGRYERTINSNFPADINENSKEGDLISWFGDNNVIYKEYIKGDGLVENLLKSSTILVYERNGKPVFEETKDETNGYVKYNDLSNYYNGQNSSNTYFPALDYFINYKNSIDSIDENFFKAGNFLVVYRILRNGDGEYIKVTNLNGYQLLSDYEREHLEKIPLYDESLITISENILPEYLTKREFIKCNIISDNNEEFLSISSGYRKVNEITIPQVIEHISGLNYPSFSDDYNQY